MANDRLRRSLPEIIEQRFAAYGHQNDLSAWEIGWFTVWVFDYCARTDKDGKKIYVDDREEILKSYELYNICAKATEVKSVHSVRNWHSVAKHVPPGLKEDYPLGLSHWKAIIPHCSGEKELREMAEKVLSWADDYGGSVISVAALRLRLAAGGNGELAAWAKRYQRTRRLCELLEADTEAPTHIRDAGRRFLRASVPLP